MCRPHCVSGAECTAAVQQRPVRYRLICEHTQCGSNRYLEATVVRFDADSVSLARDASGSVITYSYRQLAALDRLTGTRNRVLVGTAIGAGIGAAMGFGLGSILYNPDGCRLFTLCAETVAEGRGTGAYIGLMLGAGLGGLVGVASPGHILDARTTGDR